jgi:hypothetical protein
VQRKEKIMINKMSPGSGRMLKENGGYVNIADLAGESLGGKGFEFIADTVEHVAPNGMVYIALQVVDDAVIASYETEPAGLITGNTFAGESLPAGFVLYGRYTSVKLASGKVIAYKGV